MKGGRSLLEQLTSAPPARPCDVPWSAMQGGERVRHCAACDRDVWNLSAMTAREAELRLLNAPSLPCINYRLDAEGRLITRPEPRPPARTLGLGAAAFVATTLVAPGRGSLDGNVAAADRAQANAPPPAHSQAAPAPPPAHSQGAPAPSTTQPAPAKPPECVTVPLPPGAMPLTPPPPQQLGGAPPPPRELPPTGALDLRSKKPQKVLIDGVSFGAPAVIALPPGRHEAQLSDGKKTIKKTFTIQRDGTYVLDLDR